MTYKNILVPFDGSTYSKRAFEKALILANAFGSSIHVVSCINTFSAGWFSNSTYEKEILQMVRQEMKKRIAKLEKDAKNNKVRLNATIFETSSIVKQLLSYAESNNIGLIVMGSRGHSGLGRFLLGSISNGVVHKATCPVLIVK